MRLSTNSLLQKMKNHIQASMIMETILPNPNINIPILPNIDSAGKYVEKGKLIKISLN